MTRLRVALTLFALALASSSCLAVDYYCPHLHEPGAVGFNPPSGTAEQILAELTKNAGFRQNFRLRDVRGDSALAKQGAASQMCDGDQRVIFYDTAFVEKIQTSGQSNWPRYFIFAHEVAHHINNDPMYQSLDQELQADKSAARWLTGMDATVYDLVDSIKTLAPNEQRIDNYPSRCERIAGVILAYDEEAEKLNKMGLKKPLFDVGDCVPVPRVLAGGGLYLGRIVEAGARLQAEDVLKFGIPAANADLPVEFTRDVSGMCAVARLHPSERLTWSNMGVCALMGKH